MVALGRNISTPENILKIPHKLFSDIQNLFSENLVKIIKTVESRKLQEFARTYLEATFVTHEITLQT